MSKHRVTPVNIRTGAKAPSFIVEAENKTSSKEVARKEFSSRSALSKYDNWNLEVEKI